MSTVDIWYDAYSKVACLNTSWVSALFVAWLGFCLFVCLFLKQIRGLMRSSEEGESTAVAVAKAKMSGGAFGVSSSKCL